MNISIKSKRVLLAAAIFCFTAAAWETSFVNFVSAQETQRGRTVGATPTPAATPAASPASPVKMGSGQTLADLQSKIRAILARPALARGRVGIKVASLDSGKVMFEDNAE